MIKILFEEFNFFDQYPDKELQTTALLYGGVVRENLIEYKNIYYNYIIVGLCFIFSVSKNFFLFSSNMPLMFALRVVMETLSKEAESKLFRFGSIALDQFKMRLKEFSPYCERLLAIRRLQNLLQPKLYEVKSV